MGLLNFIDTGFIIILAILLLISGGIMFYCYRRLNLLEESIISQGKILQNLIINLQNNQSTNSNETKNNENFLNKNENTNDKVNVSDEEESDEDLSVEDEDEKNNIKSIVLKKNDVDSDNVDSDNEDSDNESKKSLSISGDYDDNNSIDLDIDNDVLEQSLINISFKENNNNLENDSNLTNDVKVLELSNDVLANIDDESFINNLNNDNLKTKNEDKKNDDKKTDNKIKGLNKMKLDDLKQLVIDKNINLDEDINSMKKADLIKILTN